MRWQTKICGPRRQRALRIAAVAMAASLSACRSSTEIVLVVDTNLSVPIDFDHVDISISGSDMQPTTVGLDLTAGTPFPLTLGLTPADAPGPVTVSVAALLQTRLVVQQDASTVFVAGSKRMLRMLLLDACIGISCPAEETCGSGGCMSAAIPGDSLPAWTGTAPGPPPPDTATPIDGRTVWANGWHSCANEGKILYCWGQNSDGEIGNDSTINANVRKPVMGIEAPVSVGLGQFVTCICDGSGSAWCWGRNVEGELGIGTTSMNATVPTQVPGVADCARIAGGAQHTCMVRSEGTVACWGSNASGQVGQPTGTTTIATSPMAVAGLSDVAEVRGGEQFTCARKNDMTVYCWGDNSSGQLGDGTTTSRSTPAVVTGLAADVVEIAAGRFFACARHTTGAVSCWGQNVSGQLGNGITTDSSVPVDVSGVANAAQLATGLIHVCALRTTGVVSCWGGNMDGQLGNGTMVDSLTPVDVLDIIQVTSIAAGSVHTCARHSGGVACWGENIVHQLGDGTTANRSTPVSVAGFL
jgi:alpha-tubulin suppressor-like RCC1 family protein